MSIEGTSGLGLGSAMKKKKLTLYSVDERVFEFGDDEIEALAVEAIGIRAMIHNREKGQVVLVGSRTLAKVIDYCFHQAELKTGKKHNLAKVIHLKPEEEEEGNKALIKEEEEDDDDNEDTDEEPDKETVALCNLLVGKVEAEPAIIDDTVKRWIDDVQQLGLGMLFEVIMAADILRIASLLDLVCPIMLKMYTCKDEALVYKIFNVKKMDEYTDEEIGEIIKENKLMLLPHDE